MRASFSLLGRVPAVVTVCVQMAIGALGAAACHDVDSLAPGSGGTLAQSGGAGHGGSTNSGGATASTGGDTGSTTATGGTGGASTTGTGGASTTGTGSASTGGMGGTGGAVAQMAPDFSLLDVNPASLSSGQPVSPRDYLLRVSAWYFGHST